MKKRSKQSEKASGSAFLFVRLKSSVFYFVSLMLLITGQAWSQTNINVTDSGTLNIKLVYPDERLDLRGNGIGDTGGIDLEINRGEYSETLVGITNINITAWGTAKYIDIGGVTLAGNLTIRTGYERDIIGMSGNSIRGKLKIVSGAGDDYVGMVNNFVGFYPAEILAGAGDDYLYLRNIHFAYTARLLSGLGDDVVSLDEVWFSNNANIKTNGGDDVLLNTFVIAKGNVRMFTGDGEDFVILNGGDYDRNLTVYTGADNDTLSMEQNKVWGKAVLGGAAGSADVFQYDGLNHFFSHSEIQGFETYSPIE